LSALQRISYCIFSLAVLEDYLARWLEWFTVFQRLQFLIVVTSAVVTDQSTIVSTNSES